MIKHNKDITELTDILDQDIETIVALRLQAERRVSPHQRMIEKATTILGRPQSVYVILFLFTFWIIVNGSLSSFGLPRFDSPPFPWLQGFIGLSALVMTVVILTTQTRQEKLTEQRRHLDLQITLLTERKVSKVIELLEDLRRDLPTVANRVDAEAEAMKGTIDPHTALTALNHNLQQAAKEFEFDIE